MFHDRREAGRQLAVLLAPYIQKDNVFIVGLARGGVDTAKGVADALGLSFDVACPRKIGAPGRQELAIGAVTESGQSVWNNELIHQLGLDSAWLNSAAAQQATEAKRRLDRFRAGFPPRTWRGKTIVLVDDGLATGATMRAAILGARAEGAKTVIVAVPVSPIDTLAQIKKDCDVMLCLQAPKEFESVGQFYEHFDQVTDDQVIELLGRNTQRERMAYNEISTGIQEMEIPLKSIPKLPQRCILGVLTLPPEASQIILFVHGSGSSRRSPRNEAVAAELNKQGIATLLVDLLTEQEAQQDEISGALRFDIDMLASRVLESIHWLKTMPQTRSLAIGLYGASTGAAAALIAAAALGTSIFAVVSRGGRPDLAGAALTSVRSPTLLIVGEKDIEVLALNQEAYALLECPKNLTVIPGATHLFEEPGTLILAARAAIHWFTEYGPNHI